MELLDIEEVGTTTAALAPVTRAAVALESSKTEQHLKTLPTPAAKTIVLAVARLWHTDTKTAAGWITERAAEIETLKD